MSDRPPVTPCAYCGQWQFLLVLRDGQWICYSWKHCNEIRGIKS